MSDAAPAAPLRAVIPRATYRVQLHSDFRFEHATALVPYLAALGISHLYCSPFLLARPGSRHGYDVVDHNALNPEIGTRVQFEALVCTLRAHGMGLLCDIVPNHMGAGDDNAWWVDVLEDGQASRYAEYFDIDWNAADPALAGRVLLPVLGDQYGVVLERGELKLGYESAAGSIALRYYAHRFPLDPSSYAPLLREAAQQPGADAGAGDAFARLADAFAALPAREHATAATRGERHHYKPLLKAQLAALTQGNATLRAALEQVLAAMNRNPVALDALVAAQAYRLAYWRVASDEINFRRFFDVNDLAALRMESTTVFEDTHRLILELAAGGLVDGLRIDHPDGLYDPAAYFRRLQQRYAELRGANLHPAQLEEHPSSPQPAERPLYVVAEKIVAPHEQVPADWALHGTTGYRFANVVNGLFVDARSRERLTRAWRAFAGSEAHEFEELAYRGRHAAMASLLAGELAVLANALLRLARADRRTRDFTLNLLRQALAEVVACFPVYRTYIGERPSAQDLRTIEWAVGRAQRRATAIDASAFGFVHRVLRGEPLEGAAPGLADAYLAFARRLQQYTAPVAAKGIEDTAFYRHQRLVSLNEVGGDPQVFGTSLRAFHAASRDRAEHWPHTMLATSTHDSKRSEDVRARIDVISEMPAAWRLAVRRWSRMNRSRKRDVDGTPAPSRNDEYLLYQTLVGSFPTGTLDHTALAAYCERIAAYMLKAARESKCVTSWLNPHADYEDALAQFVHAVLAPREGNLFLEDLRAALPRFAWYGALTSIAVAALKLTSPGVPDIYQGHELMALTLVDPDNRRPVDYAQRRALLQEMEQTAAAGDCALRVRTLLASIDDSRAKLWTTWRALQLRKADAALFEHGDYLPLVASGTQARHVVAFARRYGERWVIVIAARLLGQLGLEVGAPPLGAAWGDTVVALGELTRQVGDAALHDALTNTACHAPDGRLRIAQALAHFPVAIFAPNGLAG